jgi:predicted AlkP superfamily phosphohydrolase/phosphomutase
VIAVVQFDAASAALLDRLLEEGRLPNLDALRRHGRRVELETPAAHFPASAYQCLYRGVEVGDHGLFYPFQWAAGRQSIRLAAELGAPPPVWERLARAGRSTLAIDPYECHRPDLADGVLVSGWGMRERVVLERWAVPGGSDRPMRRRHGRPPDVTEIFGGQPGAEVERLRGRLLAAPARVADLAIEQIAERPFDLVWLTFAAPHLGGHRLWGTSALDDVYAEVDRQLGRVLAALPDDADVIACSVLGMDVNTSRADMLPGMLAAVLGEGSRNGGGDSDSGAMWRLRAALSGRLRGAVAAAMPDRLALELTARMELRGVDWSTTRAFAHPADNQGYVHLNLRGREREGIVDPAEADELLDLIAAGLADFRDPDGEPAVASVDRVAGRWEGEAAERLPDLVVSWRPTSAVSTEALHSERFGTVCRHGYGSGRTGNHTDGDAWAVLAPATARLREPARPPRVVDVAATVAALTGADASGLAGESLLER